MYKINYESNKELSKFLNHLNTNDLMVSKKEKIFYPDDGLSTQMTISRYHNAKTKNNDFFFYFH